MHKQNIQGRHGARYYAVQALYSFLMGTKIAEVEKDLLAQDFIFDVEETPTQKISCDVPYFQSLLKGVIAERALLEDLITPHLDRPMSELTPIEHVILWIGLYELEKHPEIPYRVVLNEAILLAKAFGAQDAHKYINGVLDKAARKMHAKTETEAQTA